MDDHIKTTIRQRWGIDCEQIMARYGLVELAPPGQPHRVWLSHTAGADIGDLLAALGELVSEQAAREPAST